MANKDKVLRRVKGKSKRETTKGNAKAKENPTATQTYSAGRAHQKLTWGKSYRAIWHFQHIAPVD
jgi:hypothetical protein